MPGMDEEVILTADFACSLGRPISGSLARNRGVGSATLHRKVIPVDEGLPSQLGRAKSWGWGKGSAPKEDPPSPGNVDAYKLYSRRLARSR
jgi:hypothetical protein